MSDWVLILRFWCLMVLAVMGAVLLSCGLVFGFMHHDPSYGFGQLLLGVICVAATWRMARD